MKPALTKKQMLADFRPFKAWRYNLDKVQIGQVVAPPYDVISPEEQKALYARDPFNCIRLILNQEEAADGDSHNRYTRARDFFKEWQKTGILTQESKPSIYYYRQTFKHPITGEKRERSALLGRLKLEDFDKRVVIPHEKTLSRPRADRRRLLETTRTNFSPVFGLYEYDHGQNHALQSLVAGPALFETEDDQRVRHALWRVDDPATIEGIHLGLSNQRIYIADGHHRYQTALEYSKEQRQVRGVSEDVELDSDFVLMALVHFYDPGLLILPTHRMVLPFNGYNSAQCLKKLEPIFNVEMLSFEAIQKKMHQSAGSSNREIQIGLYFEDGKTALLTLQDREEARKKMPQDKADLWYDLDVSLVSHLILGRLWGIPEDHWESQIRYTHSTEEALRAVREKKVAVSFFLNAPKVEILRDMGKAKELMPQKSTYFYPKLASGLLFNQFEV